MVKQNVVIGMPSPNLTSILSYHCSFIRIWSLFSAKTWHFCQIFCKMPSYWVNIRNIRRWQDIDCPYQKWARLTPFANHLYIWACCLSLAKNFLVKPWAPHVYLQACRAACQLNMAALHACKYTCGQFQEAHAQGLGLSSSLSHWLIIHWIY